MRTKRWLYVGWAVHAKARKASNKTNMCTWGLVRKLKGKGSKIIFNFHKKLLLDDFFSRVFGWIFVTRDYVNYAILVCFVWEIFFFVGIKFRIALYLVTLGTCGWIVEESFGDTYLKIIEKVANKLLMLSIILRRFHFPDWNFQIFEILSTQLYTSIENI